MTTAEHAQVLVDFPLEKLLRKDTELFDGDYVILSPAGHGRYKHAVFAHDVHLDRDVVITFLDPRPDPRTMGYGTAKAENFALESVLQANIQHDNIVKVFAFRFDGKLRRWGCVLEPFGNTDLEGLIAQEAASESAMEPAQKMRIARQTASALSALHGAGFIYRDFHGRNVRIDTTGKTFVAKLIDFGLMRRRKDANLDTELLEQLSEGNPTVTGAISYCAPECLAGEPATQASDVFSWASMTIEHLLGAHPYKIVCDAKPDRDELKKGLEARIKDPLIRNGIEAGLRKKIDGATTDLLMRCFSDDSTLRPQNAGEVMYELDRIREKRRKAVLTRRSLLGAGAALSAVTLAKGIPWAWERGEEYLQERWENNLACTITDLADEARRFPPGSPGSEAALMRMSGEVGRFLLDRKFGSLIARMQSEGVRPDEKYPWAVRDGNTRGLFTYQLDNDSVKGPFVEALWEAAQLGKTLSHSLTATLVPMGASWSASWLPSIAHVPYIDYATRGTALAAGWRMTGDENLRALAASVSTDLFKQRYNSDHGFYQYLFALGKGAYADVSATASVAYAVPLQLWFLETYKQDPEMLAEDLHKADEMRERPFSDVPGTVLYGAIEESVTHSLQTMLTFNVDDDGVLIEGRNVKTGEEVRVMSLGSGESYALHAIAAIDAVVRASVLDPSYAGTAAILTEPVIESIPSREIALLNGLKPDAISFDYRGARNNLRAGKAPSRLQDSGATVRFAAMTHRLASVRLSQQERYEKLARDTFLTLAEHFLICDTRSEDWLSNGCALPTSSYQWRGVIDPAYFSLLRRTLTRERL